MRDDVNMAMIRFPSFAFHQAAIQILKNLPDPLISLQVSAEKKIPLKRRKPRFYVKPCYRVVDISPEDFNYEGLKNKLSFVFDFSVSNIIIERNGIEIWRDQDVRYLQNFEKLKIRE